MPSDINQLSAGVQYDEGTSLKLLGEYFHAPGKMGKHFTVPMKLFSS